MTETVLVTGASGFVGSHLASALVEVGHDVRAMTRHPERYQGAGVAVAGDVGDEASLAEPLSGVTAAYYLVHSLGSKDFERKDAAAAEAFAAAAAAAGVRQIIYLGGLGEDDERLSAHLRSRRAVETLLGATGVPVTVLRAAVVIGHGGISWEITRQLVRHLPVMVAPRWVNTRTQPIALDDVIRYLIGVLGAPAALGQTFEIGGPEVLSYVDMLHRAARQQNQRRLPVLALPLLTPGLSSRWIALVTDVDVPTARHLIDSMSNEVVVHDDSITQLVPGPTIGYDEAMRRALAERAGANRKASAQA
ncbi:MAG: NAD-dependent epimerase/dehydratase family protein [Frankiales bacterium]|nr:NAD-dependent epimerase/dehydratase family protein [Frankiales bacterium]